MIQTLKAFDILGQLACGATGPKAAEVSRRLWGRERHGSTALGYGVAIPRAQIIGLRRPVAAFLRSMGPLAFDAPDGRPVFDLLAILVPKPAVPYHFALLDDARRLMRGRDFRQMLTVVAMHARSGNCLSSGRFTAVFWRLGPRWGSPFPRACNNPAPVPDLPIAHAYP